VLSDRIAQLVVAARAAERLDVLVLVERRHPLRSHLAAEPVGFLEQHHAAAVARGGERCGDTAGAAPGDQDLAGLSARRLGACRRRRDRQHRERRIAARGHPHDVDDRVE
jgi:hypothetical protein